MYNKREDSPRIGRPPLDENDESIKKSVVLTVNLLKAANSRINLAGDLSKYVRRLIRRDLGIKEDE